jgi:hypothetical protein
MPMKKLEVVQFHTKLLRGDRGILLLVMSIQRWQRKSLIGMQYEESKKCALILGTNSR